LDVRELKTAKLHPAKPSIPNNWTRREPSGLATPWTGDKSPFLGFNGFPTGVEVCPATVHGGPYPSTSDGRSASVETRAIFRFTRPVCYQGFPDDALPEELKNANPLGIWRMLDGQMTREATLPVVSNQKERARL
jgi:hypothetical protein